MASKRRRVTLASMTAPLFSGEGPQYYDAAYRHNAPFAKPGPYQTALSPIEEQEFQGWVMDNNVPFNVHDPIQDYDMRGFWKDTKGKDWRSGSHFPDTYKTPYDTTFSRESKYATSNCPFEWVGDSLIDRRNGQLIFGETTTQSSGYRTSGYGTQWHMEIHHANGATTPVPLRLITGSNGESHWDAGSLILGPGDKLVTVEH